MERATALRGTSSDEHFLSRLAAAQVQPLGQPAPNGSSTNGRQGIPPSILFVASDEIQNNGHLVNKQVAWNLAG